MSNSIINPLSIELPADRDNEALILANAIKNKDFRKLFIQTVNPSDFMYNEFKAIAWSIHTIENENLAVDPEMILLKSKVSPFRYPIDITFIQEMITSFAEMPPANYRTHIEKLHLDKIKQAIAKSASEGLYQACLNPKTDLSYLQERIRFLNSIIEKGISSSTCEFRGMDELVPAYIQEKSSNINFRTTGFRQLDEKLAEGYKDGKITIVAGLPGCLAGDTLVKINRGKRTGFRLYTLAEAYNRFHTVWDNSIDTKIMALNNDSLLQYHTINNIVSSGKKEVFEITTDSGKKIRATKDHKFRVFNHTKMDAEGFVPVSDLTIGDLVVCRKAIQRGNKAHSYKCKSRRKQTYSIPYYPHGSQHIIAGKNYKRANTARMVYEAHMNNMSTSEFINILRTNPVKSASFTYVPKDYDVHHVDHNYNNDDIYNLVMIPRVEHGKLHGDNALFGDSLVQEEHIVDIQSKGIVDTYDICCDDPYHNFLANDFVTHNSGKSSFTLSSMKNLSHRQIWTAQFALEMDSMGLVSKLMAFNTQIPISRINKHYNQLTADEKKVLNFELERLKQNKHILINDKPSQTLKQIREQIMILQDRIQQQYIVVPIDLFGKISDFGKSANFANDYEKKLNETQILARELGVHFILVAQINRGAVNRSTKFTRPKMSDLKNSGAFEEVADMVFAVHRPYYDPEKALKAKIAYGDDKKMEDKLVEDDPNRNIAEVIILKQRMGANNELVNFYFDPDTTKFSPIDREYQEIINKSKPLGGDDD